MLLESDFLWVVEKTREFTDTVSELFKKQQPDIEMKSNTKETINV